MSELSCDTLFIGRNETHDLSRNLLSYIYYVVGYASNPLNIDDSFE